MQNNTISGIDFGKNFICLAQCATDKKEILNISIQPLNTALGDYELDIKAGLTELTATMHLKGAGCVLSLLGEDAVIKTLTCQDNEEDVERQLRWELEQQIITDINDYVYDFQKLDIKASEGCSNYLVVGYRHKDLLLRTELLNSFKIIPLIVDIDIFALQNIFEHNYEDAVATPTVLAYCTEDAVKLVCTLKGRFIDSEISPLFFVQTDPDEYVKMVNDMISNLTEFNPSFSNAPVYFTGPAFFDTGLSDIFMRIISGSVQLNPFNTIVCSSGMNQENVLKYSPILSIATGLALRDVD